jgi:hypothetical protein
MPTAKKSKQKQADLYNQFTHNHVFQSILPPSSIKTKTNAPEIYQHKRQ